MTIHSSTNSLWPSEGELKDGGSEGRPEVLFRGQLPVFEKKPMVGTTCLLLFLVKPAPAGKPGVGILI